MRTASKTDGNQEDIVSFLRKIGASVQILSMVGKGCPDLLVGFRGKNYLLEIKKASGGKLTKDQIPWHMGWSGQVAIVRTKKEALEALGLEVKNES